MIYEHKNSNRQGGIPRHWKLLVEVGWRIQQYAMAGVDMGFTAIAHFRDYCDNISPTVQYLI